MGKNSGNAAEKPCKWRFANGAGELYAKKDLLQTLFVQRRPFLA